MNRQNTVIASVPLNIVCINHTNEASLVHHFGRFKTIRVSTMYARECIAITCYLLPTLSSVSSFTFIVFYMLFILKTTDFSISFLTLSLSRRIFFFCFIFSYARIVYSFYIACTIFFTHSTLLTLIFESIVNLEISSYFCN